MKSGKILETFSAKDGRRVVLRTPKWEDLDDLLELINSLVEEKAEVIVDEKLSREQEAEWLSGVLLRLEKGQIFFLVAEVDGKVVASSDLHVGRGSEKRASAVGIAVKSGFRDLGIGTRVMRAIVKEAQRIGLKVLVLSVFATNKRAIHVYEKVGFVQTGRVPKKHFKERKYIDEIAMAKLLE
ncbi:MAG: GNAT family N-acetyltransferase [Candidatus Bathyarchaeia archaeon]